MFHRFFFFFFNWIFILVLAGSTIMNIIISISSYLLHESLLWSLGKSNTSSPSFILLTVRAPPGFSKLNNESFPKHFDLCKLIKTNRRQKARSLALSLPCFRFPLGLSLSSNLVSIYYFDFGSDRYWRVPFWSTISFSLSSIETSYHNFHVLPINDATVSIWLPLERAEFPLSTHSIFFGVNLILDSFPHPEDLSGTLNIHP